ncbi:MAG: murein biosynthesis integral membrane protein MurJ [Nitrospirae bacterium]|nr:MAG: murein biosynthesis integral membrane protein MurJ [Nitrospirota bacterium]
MGVVAGGVAQLAIQLPAVRAAGYPLRPAWRPGDAAVRRVVRLMGPGVAALAILQVNILISTLLASFLPDGAVSYLYYANRVMEFPLGLFGIAIATASLPELSDHAARGDTAGLVAALNRALRLCLLLMLPAGAGMAVLARPILTLLFASGRFTAEAVTQTVPALAAFAAGVWAYATVKVAIQALYAEQDTATPMKTGAATVAVDVAASLLLMGPLAHTGLALATSLAAAFQFALLLRILRRRHGPLGGRALLAACGRALAASGAMAAGCHAFARWWGPPAGRLDALAEVAVAIPAAVALYAAALLLLGEPELLRLARAWRRRGGA